MAGHELNLRDILRKTSARELVIGHPDGAPEDVTIRIPYSARAAHMHVIGRTRSGKSRFLADLIRQDVSSGFGTTVIDPHGELVDMTVNWLAQRERVHQKKNVHIVRFGDINTTFKYNPLAIDREEEAYTVASNVANAITSVYGGKDVTETPLFGFVLDVVCTILALRGLPLAAAKYFLLDSSFEKELRNRMSEGVPNDYYRELGLRMSRMSPKEFREEVASTGRRLHQFLKNPAVERIFSTTENTANLRRVMDDGHILLLDTSDQGGLVDFSQLRALGMLFVNNLFAVARQRDPKTKPLPHYLYIDECQNYLSPDIENILSQAAKRGLFLTLSHQHLGQLVDASDLIYSGVMSGTLIKAVFGITMADAEIFADELFADRVDFERVKEKLQSPHVVGHELHELRGRSTGKTSTATVSAAKAKAQGRAHSSAYGESETETESSGTVTSDSYSSGSGLSAGNMESSYTPNIDGADALGFTQGLSAGESSFATESSSSAYSEAYSRAISRSHVSGESQSESESEGHSRARSRAKSESESVSEALRPVIKWFSTTAYTLEEQRYELKRRLAFQKERHGFMAVRREGTIGFTTRHVPDPLIIPLAEAALFARVRKESPWLVSAADIPPITEHEKVKEIRAASRREPDPTQEPDDYFEPDE